MFERLLRPRTIERRLFLWLLIITLVPSLTVLAVASWLGSEATRFVGASGSWPGVAESGRELIEQAEGAADPALREAAREHRDQLSTSLTQASRFEFLGQRLRASLPWLFLVLALVIAGLAAWAARRMARSVSRPIRELVEWSGMMAREESLPGATAREERELKELQALRGALRDAATEIRAARGRALEAERTRSWGEMARRVAHEMKNPLTPLRLASYRLQRAAAEQADLAEAIAVITDETARLEELAARFALLGRPTQGPRAPVDVAELLQRVVATDVPAAVHSTVAVAASNVFVQADYNALLQVFRNLVRNALEAMVTTPQPDLSVRITDDAERPGWVRVAVTDNGRGLGEGPWDSYFEPDFTSKAGGTGLGLAIARQTIAAHGGEIGANAPADGGAEFVVRLPTLAHGADNEDH